MKLNFIYVDDDISVKDELNPKVFWESVAKIKPFAVILVGHKTHIQKMYYTINSSIQHPSLYYNFVYYTIVLTNNYILHLS